jgi:hypothetical protein
MIRAIKASSSLFSFFQQILCFCAKKKKNGEEGSAAAS